MAVIHIEDLVIRTPKKHILSVPQLEVKKGESLVLIGASGAGKSTLLKCIALLMKHTEGDLTLFGKKLAKVSSKEVRDLQRSMVYVAQHEVMFQKTVFDNVGLGLKFRGVSKQQQREKVSNMLKLVGLEGYENRDVSTLSGGEIQRVALARGLAVEPEIIMLDEPTANLDPTNVKLMEQAITEYCKEKQATLLLATHNMNQAKRMGERCMFIHAGTIFETGKMNELLVQPKSKELQDFLEWA